MKYIRTIDIENIDNQKILEVYEITKGTEFEGLIYKCYTLHNDFTEAIVFDCDVVAQANTIEELVDGYYIDFKGLPFNSENIYTNIEEVKGLIISGYEYVVYGFIKTNKGFIYVAKMDSEGKLVLI